MAYSPAARDDADYFVVTLASICMNNDKQYQPVSESNCVPALFPVLNAVDKSYEKRIVENLLSSFEVNAVVLESRLVLVFGHSNLIIGCTYRIEPTIMYFQCFCQPDPGPEPPEEMTLLKIAWKSSGPT